jgi:hypothetical protein
MIRSREAFLFSATEFESEMNKYINKSSGDAQLEFPGRTKLGIKLLNKK